MSTHVTLPPPESVVWNGFTPPVKEKSQATFWCAVRAKDGKVFHRFLSYCNRYVMPLGDDQYDVPAGVEPVPDGDGDYYWTGWFERSCDQCDTQWSFDGEVIAWMVLPRFPQP